MGVSPRDIILVNLNSIFEYRATGETFSKKGKTDIYLNIDKGNILVFECKIWTGEAAYKEAIDQLLGYLTWRNNFGIIITFVKRKNFTDILNKIEGTATTHSSFKKGFQKISDTHFISLHRLIEDEFKSVEIHHLFYNIFSE